jgi:predicted dehydrogenase
MEAFMYRFHPQWELVKNTIQKGDIGEIKQVHSTFSYFNNSPTNIKNQAELGGGGLLDIGCYCVNFSRFMFEDEPYEIDSYMEFDPDFNTDRVASGLLKFKDGSATFMCGMQVEFDQKAQVFGTKGKIEIDIPFNDAMELQRKVVITKNRQSEVYFFDPCDQYLLQTDAFSKAILENKQVPIPLEDAVANMKVITQMFTNYLT